MQIPQATFGSALASMLYSVPISESSLIFTEQQKHDASLQHSCSQSPEVWFFALSLVDVAGLVTSVASTLADDAGLTVSGFVDAAGLVASSLLDGAGGLDFCTVSIINAS